ncbi:MAG: hypothetical protein HRT45_03545 [Bdellovibrionales bacterium]|nr:hypothetical protein [Bdellovibrionales bacterium]
MSIKVLTSPNAFSSGAQLWITPQPEHSPWTKRIDWYLNMQMRRAEKHQHREIHSDLKQTLIENELPEFDFPADKSAPLLIGCQGHLPVEAIVRVPFLDKQADWFDALRKIWAELERPQVRLFLPDNMNVEQVKSFWPEEDQHLVSIVPYSTTLE